MHPDVERVALLGWRLYPCSNSSRKGCIKGGSDAATYDLEQIERWHKQFPECNWRVVCGGSGIWGLDIDAPGPDHAADGLKVMGRLVREHGPLPAGPRTRSGGGGVALFFRHDGEPICGRTGYPEAGLDPRRGRLSITIPPSVHTRTGRPYKWLVAPWDVSTAPAPVWLLKLVQPPPEAPKPAIRRIATSDVARRALIKATDKVSSAANGSRNDVLNRQGYWIARFVAAALLSEGEAVESLYAAARHAGLEHSAIKATIKSAFASGSRLPMEVAQWP